MHRALRTFRPLLFAMGAAAAFLALATQVGADCSGVASCACFPCTSAIHLKVFDAQNNPINDDWTVEATIDGGAVDDIGNCDPGVRVGNECSFGTLTGVYRVTVRAPNFATRQLAARFAAKSGEDCCRCLTETVTTAVMEPGNP